MSNIDVVPELLDDIQNDFKEQFRNNHKVIEIYGKLKSKEATYKEANEFAIECGEMLANSYSKFISADSLPEGKMWFNIAARILEPTLHTNYSLITDVSNQVQTIFNEKQGIGLKSISPEFNQNKVEGLINKVSNAENYEDVEWVLKEPIVNFSQAIVDDAIKKNAQFHYDNGLTPKIKRRAESGCCKWCANLEGEYDYPYVPSDVYRRHEHCRCTVEYVEDGRYQNVYTKKWYDQSQFNGRLENRIEFNNKVTSAISPQKREQQIYGNQNTVNEHKSFSANGIEVLEYLKENTGENYERVKEYRETVLNFTGEEGVFTKIREYQQGIYNGSDISTIASQADTLEDFIFKMPKWDGEITYRGISVSSDQLQDWLNGEVIDNKGTSSWSTSKEIAEDFAKYGGFAEKKVVLVSETQTKGIDIAYLSKIYTELEIMVSKDAKYVLDYSKEIDDIIYMYVKEVGSR